MKTTVSILIMVLFSTLQGASNDVVSEAKAKSGIELLLNDYDWNSMWKEVTVTPKFTLCKPKNSKKGFASFWTATLIEPLYLVESTIKKGELKATNSSILNSAKDYSETGTAKDSGGVYINVMKFPVMGMILKNVKSGIMAFEKGNPKIVYLGITDPKAWNNILAVSMTPEKEIFATMKAVLAPAVGCLAVSTLDLMSPSMKRNNSLAARLKDSQNIFYYAANCLGEIPTGTSTTHHDPIANGLLAATSVFADMYSRRGIVSSFDVGHTTQNLLNGYSDKILCSPQIFPQFPKTGFTVQLIYPTISKTHEWGVDPSKYDFQGAGESEELVVFVVSQRRDYAQLAYQD